MKVKVEMITGRKWVKRAMKSTKAEMSIHNIIDYETMTKSRLSASVMKQLLLGKHSPIQEMKFWIELYVSERVYQHLVRHKEIGIYVATSRPDIEGSTSTLKGMRYLSLSVNAKRLIEISEQRLCMKAWILTRGAWNEVCKQCIALEPMLEYVLHEPCVKCGFCVETTRTCGRDSYLITELHKEYMRASRGN
jgi:hypothetical protein